MSVLVKGMEMPPCCSKCWNCDVCDGKWVCYIEIKNVREDFDKTRPDWCPLEETEPICSICKSSATGFDFKPLKHTEERKNCPMRHENGNCLAIGGFCLAVNDEICHGLHNAYNKGVKNEPVKHGHWVRGKELSRDYIGDVCVSIHYDKCWCSECNYPVEGQPLWMYCPNCGAKMDGVDNG